ncbi:hypothetical protein H924_11975 [Corynebacterium callunae DSM 20147]|uniref:Uncharacterized protein n=1 Tax=Corynebacterium callunae DSM 20147 TaxID=1121353 RepID=M1V0J3_9CORY|nr:hypothetical protein H924_11975 [Corynebacterium callunae DSM 20147]
MGVVELGAVGAAVVVDKLGSATSSEHADNSNVADRSAADIVFWELLFCCHTLNYYRNSAGIYFN